MRFSPNEGIVCIRHLMGAFGYCYPSQEPRNGVPLSQSPRYIAIVLIVRVFAGLENSHRSPVEPMCIEHEEKQIVRLYGKLVVILSHTHLYF